ncbi:hypothetical protein GUJ93_ZPchr0002g26480 [Zizania palustris]|uniref:Uncharacterized protein n=1 Tax=Zizania palustris TaxID=103762 RepID=A0A8J5REA2_ZIZPA|nr:hypothetical protein GUJ93_ZPchr0002g26480 [Zizania palustris]
MLMSRESSSAAGFVAARLASPLALRSWPSPPPGLSARPHRLASWPQPRQASPLALRSPAWPPLGRASVATFSCHRRWRLPPPASASRRCQILPGDFLGREGMVPPSHKPT